MMPLIIIPQFKFTICCNFNTISFMYTLYQFADSKRNLAEDTLMDDKQNIHIKPKH